MHHRPPPHRLPLTRLAALAALALAVSACPEGTGTCFVEGEAVPCVDDGPDDDAVCVDRNGPQQVDSCAACDPVHECVPYTRLDGYRCLFPCEVDTDCHVTAEMDCGYETMLYSCQSGGDLVQYSGAYCQI